MRAADVTKVADNLKPRRALPAGLFVFALLILVCQMVKLECATKFFDRPFAKGDAWQNKTC